MKEIIYVTTNAGKVASLQKVVESSGVIVRQESIELPELQTPDIKKIAVHKAEMAYKILKKPLLVQDSGFYLDAWPGFPGPFIKYALETIGVQGMSVLLAGRDRSCRFRNCYVYYDGVGQPKIFEDEVPGTFLTEPRESKNAGAWGAAWEVFVPEGEPITLAQMSPEEHRRWSANHQSAMHQFAKWYDGNVSV